MSDTQLRQSLRQQLDDLRTRGLHKQERLLQSPQGSAIRVAEREVINICANNYLGLANHPAIVEAAHEGLRRYGYGLASVRFICGTQELHKQLEGAIAHFLGKEDAILYTSCFEANGRGTAEHLGVLDRIDIITSTLGKALGGAAGGFTCARAEIVEFLRQRSRPYLFSNSLPPMIAMAAHKAVELIADSRDLRERMHANARQLRAALEGAGFKLRPGQHPILPVMLGDAALASTMADQLLDKGIYVIGCSYPVVPQGQARIRIQLSAAHTPEQLDRAARAFVEVGQGLKII